MRSDVVSLPGVRLKEQVIGSADQNQRASAM